MLNLLVKAALLLCVCIASTSSQKYNFQDKEYFLIKERKSFDEANTLCSSRNERLLQIKNQNEQDFVYDTIVKQVNDYVWLGATNVVGTKTFKWLGDASELNFSNWYPGQPDKDVNQRNCLAMLYNEYSGKWADSTVTNTYYVVCEQKLKTLTYLDKQYFVINQPKAFDEAVTICKNRNESLLQIKSAAENDFVFNVIVKSWRKKRIWLGTIKALGNGTYNWLDGSQLDYSNWLIGQPSEDVNQRNAIYMDANNGNKWAELPRNGNSYVICEKVSIYALKSSLLEQSNGFITKMSQLDGQLAAAIDDNLQFTSELEEQLNTLTVQQAAIAIVTRQTAQQHKECVESSREQSNEFNSKVKLLDGKLTTAIENVTEQFTSKLIEQRKKLTVQQVAITNVTEQTLQQHKEKINQLVLQLKAAENANEDLHVKLRAANEQLKMDLEDGFNTKTTQLDVQLKAALDSFNGEFTSRLKEQSNTLSAQQLAIEVVTEQFTAKWESFQPSLELEVKLNEQFTIELEKQRIALTAKQEALEKKLDNFIKWTENTPKIEW